METSDMIHSRWRVFWLLVLAALISVIDAKLPPDMNVGLLYVALVLVAAWLEEGYWTWIAAIVSTSLVTIDYFASIGADNTAPSHRAMNFVLTLFVIAVTAILTWHRR